MIDYSFSQVKYCKKCTGGAPLVLLLLFHPLAGHISLPSCSVFTSKHYFNVYFVISPDKYCVLIFFHRGLEKKTQHLDASGVQY